MLIVSRIAIVAILLAMSLASGACQTRLREPNPQNELPFGWIDTPRDGATVGRVVEVAGWALDDSTVRVVHVYVNRRYKGSAELKGSRPDVVKAYPGHGATQPDQAWHTIVELNEAPGSYDILAQAVDDRGATRDIGSLTVKLIGR